MTMVMKDFLVYVMDHLHTEEDIAPCRQWAEALLAKLQDDFDVMTLTRMKPRQLQMCALMARGLSNQGIADVMSLSEPTVKEASFRIYRHMGLSGGGARSRLVYIWTTAKERGYLNVQL